MIYSVAPATQEDLERIAQNMDPADVAEVWATSHHTPAQALVISKSASRETFAGRVNGNAICVFGVGQATLLSDVGVPWLLGTPEVAQHSRAFLRASKRWVGDQMERYTKLENFVDSRHTRAVKWLGWLGFYLDEAKPFGPDGVPFHYFHMTRR